MDKRKMTFFFKWIIGLSISRLHIVILILSFLSTNELLCQRDSSRIAQLIEEANNLLIYRYAQGVLLSPFEIKQHHRDRTIKNIEWVDSFYEYNHDAPKKDTIPFVVKDNKTIIQKPDDRFNSRTFSYYKDGRIFKMFRGRNLRDHFVNDDEGFLIQHGFGGELKKAKREEKVFKWHNVKNKRLEYTITYDEEDRVATIKTMGHLFGPGVDHKIETYSWQEHLLTSINTIKKFKQGKADSTFLQFTYDNLGLISMISSRNGGESYWSSTLLNSNIEHLNKNQLKISITHKEQLLLAITFDHLDNIVEIKNPYYHKKRIIKYRKRKRWSWF